MSLEDILNMAKNQNQSEGNGDQPAGNAVQPTGTVTIISSSEGFFTKGMESRIHELDLKTQFATMEEKSKDLLRIREKTGIYVLYLQDDLEQKVLNDVHDILNIDSKKVIIIGESEEYNEIKKIIQPIQIHKWFDRPLDMDQFLDCIRAFYEGDGEVEEDKKILIVDDDPTYVRLISRWLTDDYEVSMVTSGMQAISWLAKNSCDLIMLDYEMPVLSGAKVLEMLRSDPSTKTIPVVFLTGKNDVETVKEVLDLKPMDYILKTIDKASLQGKIKKYFANMKND